ncbi:MAG: hypothetical protein ACKO1X_06025 [Acidimicrobiales bacterium]
MGPSNGDTLRFTSACAPFQPSARWHTTADLHAAHNQTELVRRRFLTVSLDAAHRGLGTASCRPDTLPQSAWGRARTCCRTPSASVPASEPRVLSCAGFPAADLLG